MTNEEHTQETPASPVNYTESPVSVVPTPSPKPLRKHAIEHTDPEKAMDYLILTVEDPLASAMSKAKIAGLPEAAAKGLEKRLRTRYAETLDEVTPIAKEALEKRLSRRLDIIAGWLSDDKLEAKLEEAKLKDLGVYEGIMLTKLAELRGQPSIIIKTEDSKSLEDVAAKLLEEFKRRGIDSVELTERKVKATMDG